jgi:hypothetical protein
VQIYAIKGADESIVHKGHVRGNIDDRVGELNQSDLCKDILNRNHGHGGLTGFSLPGVSRSLKGWSAQIPSGFPLRDIHGTISC